MESEESASSGVNRVRGERVGVSAYRRIGVEVATLYCFTPTRRRADTPAHRHSDIRTLIDVIVRNALS
jgi:hypothetical protein